MKLLKLILLIIALALTACGSVNDDAPLLFDAQNIPNSIGLYPQENTCDTATNVGDLCLVAIHLLNNTNDFGIIGISFELGNPSYELVAVRKADENSLLSIGLREGASTRSLIAILTLSSELFTPSQNGRVASVVMRRVSPSRNMFVLSNVYLGASTAYPNAHDIVLEQNLAF
ncbi:MAG: hypothetical protein AAF267_19170 [Deinococcota bacterium]